MNSSKRMYCDLPHHTMEMAVLHAPRTVIRHRQFSLREAAPLAAEPRKLAISFYALTRTRGSDGCISAVWPCGIGDDMARRKFRSANLRHGLWAGFLVGYTEICAAMAEMA